MANQIILRRTSVPGRIPTVSQLEFGELAVNTHDGKVYFKRDNGFGPEIIELGTSGSGGTGIDSALLDLKVDKVEGKGLSTNDFDDFYKLSIDFTNSSLLTLQTQLNSATSNLASTTVTLQNGLLDEAASRTIAVSDAIQTVNTYTDSKFAAERNARIDNDTVVLNSAKAYTDTAIDGVTAGAIDSAVDQAVSQSLSEVNSILTNSETGYQTKTAAAGSRESILDTLTSSIENLRTYTNNANDSLHNTINSETAASIAAARGLITTEIDDKITEIVLDASGVVGETILAEANSYTDTGVAAEAAARTAAITNTVNNAINTLNTNLTNAFTAVDAGLRADITVLQGIGDGFADSVVAAIATANNYTNVAVADITVNAVTDAVTQANTYTDSETASTKSYVAGIYATKTALDNRETSIRSALSTTAGQIYAAIGNTNDDVSTVNGRVTSSLAEAKSYTDSHVAAAIAGDTQLAQAKVYADQKDQLILSQAQTYANTASQSAASLAVIEARSLVADEVADRAAAVTAVNNRVDDIISNTDSQALDSLTEIVAAFQEADGNMNNAITALSSGATAALATETAARIAADVTVLASANAYTDSKTLISGSDTQVLFNNAGEIGASNGLTFDNSSSTLTADNITLQGAFKETVYNITDNSSVDINPLNGTVQTWTLNANRTPAAVNFASGQSVTLMINSGVYTVTWTNIPVSWIGVTAPTFSTGFNVVELWKVGAVIYGAFIGTV